MGNLEDFVVQIEDDFDLEKIADCGQCFRARKLEDGFFRFLTGSRVLYIRRLEKDKTKYSVSCSREEWEGIWSGYFDLSRDYRALRQSIGFQDSFIRKAFEAGCGLRVLHQDPWEMLITFIISQRKNMPAISKCVEALAKRCGKEIRTGLETVYAFPTPEELSSLSQEELADCKLGYRVAYVRDAAKKVVSGELDLKAIALYDDGKLFQELMRVRGVGKKVADCVCLFGYGRFAKAPVDVWISRAIQEEFHGRNPFPDYGDDAGIVQQYIFYYETHVARGRQGVPGRAGFINGPINPHAPLPRRLE